MSSDSKTDINIDNLDEETKVSVSVEKTSKDKADNSKFMAVIKALAANIGIALVKLICFFFCFINL